MYVAYAYSYAAGRTLLEPGVILRPRYGVHVSIRHTESRFRKPVFEFRHGKCSASRHAETQSHTCKLVASRTVTNLTGGPFIIWTWTVGVQPQRRHQTRRVRL
jgi:hypothetical protein